MRYIPTFSPRVEELKNEAKKLQRKRGGKHTDHLNRVAKGAGYEHWHHVVLCHKETLRGYGGKALLDECRSIVLAEQEGRVAVVMTGPEIQVGPFVFFSSGIGDAWLLSPEENLCLCLMWRGEVKELQIQDTQTHLHISWDGRFELIGNFMHVAPFDSALSPQTVGGYPLEGVRKLITQVESFEKKFLSVIEQDDAQPLTQEVIADLVRQGWDEADLKESAADGFRYSASRNSLLSPVFASEAFDSW